MQNIIHVGPRSGVGGIQSVIRTLHQYPIESYAYHVIDSTSNGHILTKIRAYVTAKSKLKEIINSTDKQTIVHLHSASDFSFRRKIRLAKYAYSLGGKIIFHIHSGQIIQWLKKGKRAERYKMKLNKSHLNQSAMYNKIYRSRYLMVSNGMKHIVCEYDWEKETFKFRSSIPEFSN